MKQTISISVVSGKGGVGKSNLALNIAYSLYLNGYNTLLVDCDLGLSNLDILLGKSAEKYLQDLLNDVKAEEIVLPLRQHNSAKLDLIPSNSGLSQFNQLSTSQITEVCQKLLPLLSSYDFAFFDIGAGISSTAIKFSAKTRTRILIVTPEPTSLTDGYAFIKVMYTQENISEFYILVNQAESTFEAEQTFQRLYNVCEHFLQINIRFLGLVHTDSFVHEAVKSQKPFIEISPSTPASQDCKRIAETLLNECKKRYSDENEDAAILALDVPNTAVLNEASSAPDNVSETETKTSSSQNNATSNAENSPSTFEDPDSSLEVNSSATTVATATTKAETISSAPIQVTAESSTKATTGEPVTSNSPQESTNAAETGPASSENTINPNRSVEASLEADSAINVGSRNVEQANTSARNAEKTASSSESSAKNEK